jgi:hypothetical protein
MHVLQAPDKVKLEQWVRQIKWRMVAQQQEHTAGPSSGHTIVPSTQRPSTQRRAKRATTVTEVARLLKQHIDGRMPSNAMEEKGDKNGVRVNLDTHTVADMPPDQAASSSCVARLLGCCNNRTSQDGSSLISLIGLAFKPWGLTGAQKLLIKALTGAQKNKLFECRLALFWVFSVCAFITSQALLASPFTRSLLCIICTAISNLTGVFFVMKSTAITLDLTCNRHPSKDAGEEKAPLVAVPAVTTATYGHQTVWNPQYQQSKRASSVFIITGNLLAMYTIAVDGCDQLHGSIAIADMFFAVVVLDFALLLASRCTEWSIVRSAIKKDVNAVKVEQYLDKTPHLSWSRFLATPNLFYCCAITMVWCNITALGFIPELQWDRTYAFGWFWENLGVGNHS